MENKGSAILLIIALVGIAILATAGGVGYKYFLEIKIKDKTAEESINKTEASSSEYRKEEIERILMRFKEKSATSSSLEATTTKSEQKTEEESIAESQKQQPKLGPKAVSKKFNVANIIPAVVMLKCYYRGQQEPSVRGSGLIVETKQYISNKIIDNFTIFTTGHVVIDDSGDWVDGCDIYISNEKGTEITKRFYATVLNNYLFHRMMTSNTGVEVDGLDLAKLTIVGEKKGDPINYAFIPENLKGIYGLTAEYCTPEYLKEKQYEIKIGENIYAIGYPAIGGETVTITNGVVSGFIGYGPKISANIDEGNSGGLIISDDGCPVGMILAGLVGKMSMLGYGISEKVMLEAYPLGGDSTFALAVRDVKRINDWAKFILAIDKHFNERGSVPEAIDDLGTGYFPDKINYPTTIYRYAYRSDRKAYHLGVALEETTEQFNKYNPLLYDSNDSDFNSQNLPGWVNGFNGTDSEACLPLDKKWYQPFEGRWCFDAIQDYSTTTSLFMPNYISNNFASLLNIFINLLGKF